jgi:hypothetical protein
MHAAWVLLSFSGILFSMSIWYGLLVAMPDELLENDVDKFAVSQVGQIHVQLVACMTLQSSSDTVAHEVCIHALYLSHSMARL